MREPADLPPELRAVIEAVVSGARLGAAERALVRAELEDHFLSALASGLDAASAVREFGDPSLTARLIGRSQRRNRPPAERLLRGTAIAFSCVSVFLGLPYGYSAWRLSAAPAVASAPAVEAGLDREPTPATPIATASGVLRSLEEARRLRSQEALVPELRSAQLYAEAVSAFARAAPHLEAGERAGLHGLLSRGGFEPRRTVVATALAQALDRVYPPAGDSHPTRAGLRSIRRIKGGTPTWRADLLEPAWFLFAADRREAEALARALLSATWDGAGGPRASRLRHELASHPSVPRAFAVQIVMSRVAGALEAGAEAGRTLARIGR